MPLSYGVLIGLVIAVVGAVLWAATRKKLAWIVVGVGAAVVLLTLILIGLAALSPM